MQSAYAQNPSSVKAGKFTFKSAFFAKLQKNTTVFVSHFITKRRIENKFPDYHLLMLLSNFFSQVS